jgi:V/A-type H+-transporting ATPase subunit B
MYTDLATVYERAGRIRGKPGSITQIPILTMPSDDITHPVPDLTGYITEGQITLGRELDHQGIYPPIAVLPSLSRLMKDGIGGPKMIIHSERVGSQSRMMDHGTGKDRTRADHPHLAAQIYAAYAHTQDVRALASVIGEEELGTVDQQYLKFGRAFEREFVNQGFTENRTIEQTLNIGWRLLSMLPQEELTRVSLDEIKQYYRPEHADH